MNPDRWLVITVRVPDEDVREALVDMLLALGGAAVEEDVDLLTTYILPPEDPERFLRDAADRLDQAAGQAAEVIWRWQSDEDWAEEWKRGLKPRRVGERLVVTPTWAEPETRAGDIVLAIDPEMAFGTGEHASTRGALRLTEAAVRGGDRVLDVGSGSGILAIAAARLGAAEVLAVECDADALENAHDNIARNGVADRVEFVQGLVDLEYLKRLGDGRFEVILGNVLSGVLRPLLPGFHDALTPGGRVVLAGIMEHEADEVIEAAEAAGFELVREDLEEEWWAGLVARPDRAG